MFLSVSGTVVNVEPDEAQRQKLAGMVARERVRRFRGDKKALYTAAGINAATLDRVENGDRVRGQSLVAVVMALWPHSGGDWSVPLREAEGEVELMSSGHLSTHAVDSEGALEAFSTWAADPDFERPPKEALMLYSDEMLLSEIGQRMKVGRAVGQAYLVQQAQVHRGLPTNSDAASQKVASNPNDHALAARPGAPEQTAADGLDAAEEGSQDPEDYS